MPRNDIQDRTTARSSNRRFPRRLATLAGLAFAITVGADVPPVALSPAQAAGPFGGASSAVMRAQTSVITNAINRQVQRAMRPKLVVRNSAGPISAVELGTDGRFLAIASADSGVRVWDLENGRQTQQLDTTGIGAIRSVDVAVAQGGPARPGTRGTGSAPQRLVVAAGDNGTAILFDAVTGAALRRLTGHSGAILSARFSPDLQTVATAGSDGTVRLWEVASGRQKGQLSGHSGAVNAIAFSPSGQLLVSGGADGAVRLWQTASGTAVRSLTGHSGAVRAVAFAANETQFYSGGDDGRVRAWTTTATDEVESWRTGDPVTALSVNRDGRIATAGGGSEIKVWKPDGSRITEIDDEGNRVSSAVFTPATSQLIGAGTDGRAKIWDGSSGQYRAQLILTRSGWAVTDADGRFDGSDAGLGNVSWAGDNKLFEIANFSDPYYEPGLLAKTLRAQGALITAGAPAVEAGVGIPPTVTLSAASGSQASVPGPSQVTVVAQDQGAGIDKVVLYQNGKAVDPAQIASDQTGSGSRPSRTVTWNVELGGGVNQFRASAFSIQRIEGVPAELSVAVRTPEPKPSLHAVIIGINQYANPQLTLNYAVADAKGFVDWAKKQARGSFGKIEVHQLLDRQATRANILDLFKQLESTKPEDVVVIYLAGHGENAEQSWFFLPTEFGRTISLAAVASEGLSSQMIEQAVVKMGAQHVFLLIDACKSGSLQKAFAADADRKDISSLSRDAGIHVLAATNKDQLAVELSEIGHGAFTYTVLDALKGKADRQPRDGVVRAREILQYAEKEVPLVAYKYTNLEQFPTVFSRGADFEISRGGR
ncbi:MAG: hypothetical protein GC191_16595 [Azospirillum sp.]|nr:hypothetical protein [Azospirillum sp.]